MLRVSGGTSIVSNDSGASSLSNETLTVAVEDALRLNATGVAVSIFVGSEHERQTLDSLARLVDEGQRWGLPVLAVTAVGRDMARDLRYLGLACRIAAEVDSIGGFMDAFTAKEYASFHLKVLDEHLPLAVEILGDIVQNPLFDAEEMAREKKVIFEEMSMVEDTPDDLVTELFAESFWPRHPLGRPILGTRASVGRFRREDLASHFRRVYHPGNILIAAAGHLEHGTLEGLVTRHFAGLEARPDGGRDGRLGMRQPATACRTVVRSKKNLEQVHVCLGARAYAAHIAAGL